MDNVLNDGLGTNGSYRIIIRDSEGNLKSDVTHKNKVVKTSQQHLLNMSFGGKVALQFYFYLTNTTFSALDSTTMSSLVSSTGEFVGYSEPSRVQFFPTVTADATATNTTQKAIFTITQSVALTGAGLTSNSVKGSTSGELFSFSNFAQVKNLNAGDTLEIVYTLSLTSF